MVIFFGASILEVEEFCASHYSSARLAQSRVCRALHGEAFAGNRWLRGAGATGKPARDEGHSCGCHAHKTVPLVASAAGSKKIALPRLGCLEVWRGALSHENFLLCEWVENRNTHSHHVFNISGDKFHFVNRSRRRNQRINSGPLSSYALRFTANASPFKRNRLFYRKDSIGEGFKYFSLQPLLQSHRTCISSTLGDSLLKFANSDKRNKQRFWLLAF